MRHRVSPTPPRAPRRPRRVVGPVLRFALALILVAGCGEAVVHDQEAGNQPPAASDEEVVLELWYMPNGSDPESMIDAEVDHFEDLHPGVRVNATLVGWEEALTKLTTATTGGGGADVTQVGSTWVSGLSEAGGFRVYDDEDLARLGGREQFVRESWSSTMAPDGSTVAVPWMVDTRVLYYRTDVFDDLGIEPDAAFRDWASFEETLRVIEAGTDMHPLGVPGRNDWNVVHNVTPWIWAAGGTILSDDGAITQLGTAETVAGIHRFQRLVQRYAHPDLLTSTDDASPELFANGEFAIAMSGPWFGPILLEEHDASMPAERWSAAPLPAGPAGRVSFLGGSHLAILGSSQHPVEAMALVEFLTARDSQERVSSETGLLPANTTAATVTTGAVADAFQQALASGRQYPSLPGWLEVETTLQRSFSHMWERIESTGRPLTLHGISTIMADTGTEIDAALAARTARAGS